MTCRCWRPSGTGSWPRWGDAAPIRPWGRRYADPGSYLFTPERWEPRRAEFCALVGKPANRRHALDQGLEEFHTALADLEPQSVVPSAGVVYVDNDPIVLTHARALLTSTSGPTALIDADLRDPGRILSQAAGALDFTEPVALMMIAVLHLIPDEQNPWGLVSEYLRALPSGSYLVVSHPASDVDSGSSEQAAQRYNERVASRMRRRSRDEMARFFDGLDLVEPGIVQLHHWRAAVTGLTAPSSGHTGVGRKP